MLGCKGFVFDGSFDTDYTLLTINQISFWENDLHQPLTLSSKQRTLSRLRVQITPSWIRDGEQ